jgi:hypothetical protein
VGVDVALFMDLRMMTSHRFFYAPHWLGSCSAQSVNCCSNFVECNVGVRVTVDMTCKEESYEVSAQSLRIAI